MIQIFRRVSLLICLACSIFALHAQDNNNVSVSAALDSMQIRIGEPAHIKLDVSTDAGKHVQLPMYAPGDTIVKGLEVLEVAKPDTQWINNKKRMLIQQQYTVTAFDSALIYVPSINVMQDSTTYKSGALTLKVLTVPVDTLHKDKYFPAKGAISVSYYFSDFLPSIGAFILVVILALLFVWLMRLFVNNQSITKRVKVEPKKPAYEVALYELEHVEIPKDEDIVSNKIYYTEITDAVRTYIEERYEFPAMGMTSTEILDELLKRFSADEVNEMRALFSTSDLVKFAKYSPDNIDKKHHLESARSFVDKTKVVPSEEEKPQIIEETIVEGRSKTATYSMIAIMVAVGVGAIVSLGFVIYELYNLLA